MAHPKSMLEMANNPANEDDELHPLAKYGSVDAIISARINELRALAKENDNDRAPAGSTDPATYNFGLANWLHSKQAFPPRVIQPPPPAKTLMSKWHLFPVDIDKLSVQQVPPPLPARHDERTTVLDAKAYRKLTKHNAYVKCFRTLQIDGWMPYEKLMVDTVAMEADLCEAEAADKDADIAMKDVTADDEDEEVEEVVTAEDQARSERTKAIAWWMIQYVAAK